MSWIGICLFVSWILVVPIAMSFRANSARRAEAELMKRDVELSDHELRRTIYYLRDDVRYLSLYLVAFAFVAVFYMACHF